MNTKTAALAFIAFSAVLTNAGPALFGGQASLVSSAAASESLSPEGLLPLHESRDAYTPTAAFGKDVYLVVWQSGRFGPGDLRNGFDGLGIGDIVGCRLDKAGKPLDAKPFVICGAKDLQEHPKVAFGNGVFLVVWHDLRGGKDWDVYAARVSPDGKVLDSDGFLVAGGANNQACPRVAWDGRDFTVVWQDFRSDKYYEAYGARVSAEGKVADGQGVLLASGVASGYHCDLPAVASLGGGKSLGLWLTSAGKSRRTSAGTTFIGEGRATPGAIFMEGQGPGKYNSPACLAAGAKTYLTAWRTETHCGRGNAPNDSNAMILDADGKCVKRLYVSGKGSPTIQAPDVAWDGSAFVAAWHETQFVAKNDRGNPYLVVCASRISEAGDLVGTAQTLSGTLESPAAEPAVASDGAGTALIAYEKHPDKADVPIKIGFRLLSAR
jgi:hypothetical protein